MDLKTNQKIIKTKTVCVEKLSKPVKEFYVEGTDEAYGLRIVYNKEQKEKFKNYIKGVRLYKRVIREGKHPEEFISPKAEDVLAYIADSHSIDCEKLYDAIDGGLIPENTILSEDDVAKINTMLPKNDQIEYQPHLICHNTLYEHIDVGDGSMYSSIALARVSKPDDDLPNGYESRWYEKQNICLYKQCDTDSYEEYLAPLPLINKGTSDELKQLLKPVLLKISFDKYDEEYYELMALKYEELGFYKNTEDITNRLRKKYSSDNKAPVEQWAKLSKEDIHYLSQQLGIKLNDTDTICYQEI